MKDKSSKRFQIKNKSVSGHCCFDFTIVDTSRPNLRPNGEHYFCDGEYQYEPICECFEKEEAQKICDAMNLVYPCASVEKKSQ